MSQNDEVPNAIFLAKITLNGFRGFSEGTEINFTDSEGHPAQWTVILGENGTAKTGVLQAIGATAPIYDQSLASTFGEGRPKRSNLKGVLPGWRPKSMEGPRWISWWDQNRPRNRENIPDESCFSIQFCSSETGLSSASTEMNKKYPDLPRGCDWRAGVVFGTENGHTFARFHYNCLGGTALSRCMIFGYGASRLIQDRDERSAPKRSVNSLFSSYDVIDSPENWLVHLDHFVHLEDDGEQRKKAADAFESARRCICAVLPDIDDIKIVKVPHSATSDAEVRAKFKCPYGWVYFDELGQGYQSMASWAIDLLRHLHHHYSNLDRPETGPAVVLIDEFDLHLHPKWQITLMNHLGKIFENCQFIITAHSPLLVQAAGANTKLIVLRHQTDENGVNWIVADSDPVRVRGWRLDQIITSDLFGLSSARPAEFAELFEKRAKLVANPKRTKNQEKELKDITEKIEKEAPPSISMEALEILSKLRSGN